MRIIRLGNTAVDAANGKIDNNLALLAVIFGEDGVPQLYEPAKTYNKNDKAAVVDANGNLQIYVALENNITGEFDNGKWRAYVSGANSVESKATMIAVFGSDSLPDEYNPNKTYRTGATVLHDGTVYKAIENATGPWDQRKWSKYVAGDDSDAIAEAIRRVLEVEASKLALVKNDMYVSSLLGI